MGSFYKILILCDPEKKLLIDDILGISTEDPKIGWSLVIEESSPKFNVALHLFIDITKKNLTRLNEVGISIEMITFWYMYEYEQQCNMEFEPDITKKTWRFGRDIMY